MLDPRELELIDQLDSDPYIGPGAPGDGDIIEWWFGFVLVLLAALSRIANVQASGSLDAAMPPRTKGAKLPEHLATCASIMVEGLFPDLDQPSWAIWQELYGILEDHLAENWGGRRVRIPVRPKKIDPIGKLAQGLQAGLPLDEVFARAGVSRATGYRILGRKH